MKVINLFVTTLSAKEHSVKNKTEKADRRMQVVDSMVNRQAPLKERGPSPGEDES